uniref:Membrane transporter protein n=1 Tax=viral metagenome TaxID=1070528 RepID=A0A6C0JGL6_9ZZZZ
MVIIPYIIYLIIGILAGISMGIIGIGAGVITLPLLIYSGMNIRKAVGCILLMQLLPQSLFGVISYHEKGFIEYHTALTVTLGSIFGIIIGSSLVSRGYINEDLTYKILTIILIITAIAFTKRHLLHM